MPVRKLSQGHDMIEHDDLVAEIPHVEKMATAERLKHAKKRRQQQLKKFSQYEKQLEKEQNKKHKNKNNANKRVKKASHNRRVNFVNNVMLLEAAARNDVAEGESTYTLAFEKKILRLPVQEYELI